MFKRICFSARDTRTYFCELLDRIAEGEEITITRHGTAVARLVPPKDRSAFQQRRDAIDAMRSLAKQNRLGRLKIKKLISEGRP